MMLNKISFAGMDVNKAIILVWTSLIIVFFAMMSAVIFPVMIIKSAPQTHVIEGVNGYVAITDDMGESSDDIFKLRGEWEFYPGQLYSFNDFTNGRTGETRIAKYPHYWKNEPDSVIDRVGYATYRMRVRIPPSFDGLGLYSRYQYSAYEIYLNDILICEAGTVSEDFSEYEPVYLPSNGYTFASIGSEGRTFSVIMHVQNDASDRGGFGNDIFIGSAQSIKNLRTLLVLINGFISGGLLLLFLCLFLIYLSGRERKEYLDYTIVALVALFISLTNGGESLMYSIGIDSILLMRLEYCAFVTGAFFANYSVLKQLIKSKPLFYMIHIYTAAATGFFLFAPTIITSKARLAVIAISAAFFVLPLINSFKKTVMKPDYDSIISLLSYISISIGICLYAVRKIPWDSIDVFSISIMVHCILQMLIFLHRYQKTETTLKDMTETLEERITERTIELTLMKEKAEAATVSKSQFLANMSHEIRTPMNAIMGISDLMRTDNLDKTQLSYLMDIKKSSKALLQIINDILDFSKIEAGKLEIIPAHFNLMAAYDNICSICQFSADAKDLQFIHSFAPDVPHYIYGDEIRIRQVVLNIINNAIKYTKEGSVTFKVEKAELYGIPFLSFTVEDTGIGIKTENFTKLFNSFEQLDSESNRKIVGTGLGLSVSKLLVTLMNGDIQVESEYGKGSVFKVLLPLTKGDSDQVVMQEAYIPIIASEASVLVVDDNQINLRVAEGFLAIHGILPDTALSGEKAIEKIRSKHYDLVFMDHMMPEMDGVEATKIIRTIDDGRYADIPIVALTANAVTGAKDIFLAAGMNDFLSKPIDASHINMILARWLPEEKVSRQEAQPDNPDGENADQAELFKKLRKIEDLDVNSGVSHIANNKSAYISILKQFCNEFDEYVSEIMTAFKTDAWTDYTIRVHAMKGVFSNLGESKLAEWAYKLELASKNGEYSQCQSETEAFCETMAAFRDELLAAGLTDTDEPVERTSIGTDELKRELEDLSNACMFGDSDSAEQIRQELNKRSFNDEIDARLNEIYALIDSYDFEIVAEKIKDVLTRI